MKELHDGTPPSWRQAFSYKWQILLILTFLLGVNSAPVYATQTAPVEIVPANTPIEHFIFLMQENHSFDNYFGTYPGADGIPEGVCMPVDPFDDANETCIEPFHFGEQDIQMDDPDHSEETHKLQYNEGKMDGFYYALNRRGQDGRLAMVYYDDNEIPYHWNVADEYVLFDAFFSSAAGGSFINHSYWISAQSGSEKGRDQQEVLAETTTIFDLLEERGISWKFYVQNYEAELTYRTLDQFPGNRTSQVIWVPLLNFDRFLDDPVLNSKIVDISVYYDDLVNGTLPQVAYMVPSGPSEHPPSSLLSGQRFIKTLIQSLMQSSYWERSAFLWSYDDWGGWYDHVPPPQVDEDGYGFRVPALLVSPYAKKGHIESTVMDYTSALKFIEENWDIPPLAERDANANSIITAFDFDQPPRPAKFIPFDRDSGEVKVEPRRGVIYGAYGAALLLAVGLISMAMIRSDRDETLAVTHPDKKKKQTKSLDQNKRYSQEN
jgi:phospholipase C